MYDVLDVAKYVIHYSRKMAYPITNLKLQKILYFIQAEFLVTKGLPCFSEEIEAWDFGPVVPEVYHRYKVFGSSNIIEDNSGIGKIFAKSDKEIIKNMVTACSRYTASQLVDITHKQSPWLDVYERAYNKVIPKSSIKEFFNS